MEIYYLIQYFLKEKTVTISNSNDCLYFPERILENM